jgi:hypothetical protein
MPGRISFLVLFLIFYTQVALSVTIPAYDMKTYDREIDFLYHSIKASHSNDIKQRIIADSRYFLSRSYLFEPLGEGKDGQFDQGPLYRTDIFDCVTFVDTVIGLAESNNLDQFKHNIIKIRYQNAKISFFERNHNFIVVDWNPENQHNGYIKDLTYKIIAKSGQPIAEIASTIIDEPNWYRLRKSDDIKLLKNSSRGKEQYLLKKIQANGSLVQKQKSVILYLPLSKLFTTSGKPNMDIFNQIPSGSVIEIIRPNWSIKSWYGTNLNVSHLGIAIRDKNNQLIFRNASSISGKVMDVSLITYLQEYLNSKTVRGIHVEEIVWPADSRMRGSMA